MKVLLQPLGISAGAEAIYIALGHSAARIDELARRTELPADVVRSGLDELRRVGLAMLDGTSWQRLPLLEVVNKLKEQRISEIELAAVTAESLESQLLAATEQADDEVRILVGREAVVAAQVDLMRAAKVEICAFDKPPYALARANVTEDSLSAEPEWQALERGVSIRGVYHPGFDPDRLTELTLFAKKGERSRTASVPMKLILVDNQVALIPSMRSYNPGHELRASIVRHPLLVEALQFLFEAVWDAAVPIVTSFPTDSDPRRKMLVSLLMTGSTDSAIANSLNLNVRSVRRWIAELMDELGVTSRLQLGAALVRADGFRRGPKSSERSSAEEATPAV